MDEINDFFDLTKNFVRKPVPNGYVESNIDALVPPMETSRPVKREFIGKEWSKKLVSLERSKMDAVFTCEQKTVVSEMSSRLYDLENLSDSDSDMDTKGVTAVEKDVEFYEKYKFDLKRDASLSIYPKRNEILQAIKENPVVVLQGDTGCGKTTQVPQYILDDACKRQEYCKIICTQPRRIAAISLSNRVAEERHWDVGSVVGYKVGLHCNLSDDTRLIYCTTGVLLELLVSAKTLSAYTHIILDEVHERDQEMDFLLIVVRRLLFTNSKNVKIILMSATIDAKMFSEYFAIRSMPAPIIDVSGKRNYSVREYFLDDMERIITEPLAVNFEDPTISPQMYMLALKLIIVLENIEREEELAGGVTKKNSMLIFLPGINEMNEMMEKLENINTIHKESILLYPIRLHSMIAPDEQVKVFRPAPLNHRKIILSTNIAESSITVPDVKYVIDFCLTKYEVTDTATNFTSLKLEWASQSNCKQRSGRAGRVMNGRVYRLVPKSMYMYSFGEFAPPEMLRCPLNRSVLKAKLLNMDTPANILALAMTPPNLSDVLNTILTLKEVGALYTHSNNVYSTEDGDLTLMGRVMAGLPLDINLTRLIILGYMFSTLEEAIIIAAGLSVRSIFTFFNKDRLTEDLNCYIQKLVWADGSGSDLFAILKAYKVWSAMREQHNMSEDQGESAWAKRYFINLRAIREMHLLVVEIKHRLVRYGLISDRVHQRVAWIDREKTIILKIIIAGAFYPNYFTNNTSSSLERGRNIYQTLCGNDPCNTVYFTNFSTKQIGPLYADQVKELFKLVRIPAKNIDVRFQSGSERVFVTFNQDPDEEYEDAHNRLTVPGRVRPEIYKALRMRSTKMDYILSVMKPSDDEKYAQEHNVCNVINGAVHIRKNRPIQFEDTVLPSVYDKFMTGIISHIESCNKFFFQPSKESKRLEFIQKKLNARGALEGLEFRDPKDVSRGMWVVAPMGPIYYRARVLKVFFSARHHIQFKVLFIDYGNVTLVNFLDLRQFAAKFIEIRRLPPPMFECRLALIQPSSVKSPNGKWAREAIDHLREFSSSGPIKIEVYSVVSSVVNVIIPYNECSSINDFLVDRSLARKSDENYMSNTDHDLRLRRQAVPPRYRKADKDKEHLEYLELMRNDLDMSVPPPPLQYCSRKIQLRGPFSPLESHIFPVIRIGAWKLVSVEKDSVLSLNIDTDPQDVHERLIVSACIGESAAGDTIIARSNTLMPNIPGFGALMALLFCPTMQLKVNKAGTRYVALLAGLGYDEKFYDSRTNGFRPLYEEHDIMLHLDTDILTDDVELINQLRYCMDTMLYCEPGDDKPAVQQKTRADLAAKIKNILVRLLNKNRNYIESSNDAHSSHWERYRDEDIMEMPMFYDKRSIFPAHCVLRLNDENSERQKILRHHCEELHRFRQFDSLEKTTCRLCNQPLDNVVQLRIHLLSQLHRDREQQIGFKVVA